MEVLSLKSRISASKALDDWSGCEGEGRWKEGASHWHDPEKVATNVTKGWEVEGVGLESCGL
jgi:hypothetical protein